MSFHAPNQAGSSDLFSCPIESANKSLSTCNNGGELHPSCGARCRSNRTAIAVNFRTSVRMRTLLWDVSAVVYPVFCPVTASGSFRRPAALGLLLRIARPFGVLVPPKTSLRTTAKYAIKLLSGPSRKADLRRLGAGPTR
jgi:hypothetical protein